MENFQVSFLEAERFLCMLVFENSRFIEACCIQVGQLSNRTAWKVTVGNLLDSASAEIRLKLDIP